AKAELELARTYRDRAERLLAERATSREEYEQLVADAEVAEAQLRAVEAALAAAKLDLEFTRVTSPIDGRVSRAVVTPGNLVDSTTLLTTVVADDPIHAYFDVDEHTYLELMRGAAAKPHEQTSTDAKPHPHRAEGLVVFVGLANEQGFPHVAQ